MRLSPFLPFPFGNIAAQSRNTCEPGLTIYCDFDSQEIRATTDCSEAAIRRTTHDMDQVGDRGRWANRAVIGYPSANARGISSHRLPPAFPGGSGTRFAHPRRPRQPSREYRTRYQLLVYRRQRWRYLDSSSRSE